MRIAIIGPAHPYKGGIAQATTELAHKLEAAGHEVTIISWRHQYPFFYPGQQFVPGDEPERPIFQRAERRLSWRSPAGWWRIGRELRTYDRLILVWWVALIQGPVYLTILRALGKKRPPITLLCHNILPHESRPAERQLARAIFKAVDRLVVHTKAEASRAGKLTKTTVVTAPIPLALPGPTPDKPKAFSGLKRQLLFFGLVRPYKGLDVLLRALAVVPDVELVVAGEIWGSNDYSKLIQELGLTKRVHMTGQYLPSRAIPEAFTSADALVLPYREGTASWNAEVAFTYGIPVIASTAGSMADQVRDGIDGLLCKPNDVASLAAAISHFYEPGVAQKLYAGIPAVTPEKSWDGYIAALTD